MMNDGMIRGKCSQCGGVVSTPKIWHGVGRPPSTCESCGAVADETANLPVIPMKPVNTNNNGVFFPEE